MRKFFITGTDTEIGKTMISMLITKTLVESGKNVEYFKPFQTGCKDEMDVDSDAKFVIQNIESWKSKPIRERVGVIYKNPKAPWFAARNEDKIVDLEAVEKAIPNADITILEGAGGLMVPITENILAIDWIKNLEAEVLLVARAGLGTINHTLLSLAMLKAKKIKTLGVIFSNPQNKVSPEMISENIEAIEKFGETKVLGVIPHIEDPKSSISSKIILNEICDKILLQSF
ncbi:MAG: dethiobiotin synthase [Candidatus Cloacimonetes bacterium]|nr:dethiobiotin synthase [Candidatus Cloacimonadota bacterium]